MLDKEKFKRKLLMRALLSAQSMGPLTVGFLALMAMFFIGIKALPLFIIGVGGLILGAVAGLKRLLLPNAKMTEQIMAEISREKAEADERTLNDLQRKLQADGDPHTDELLSDLRTLMNGFRSEMTRVGRTETLFVFNDAEKLFDRCVHDLERTLSIHQEMLAMRNPSIRKGLAGKRAALIKEIEESLKHLSEVHLKVQQLSVEGQDSGSALRSIRSDLDTGLRIMEEVDRQKRDILDPDAGKDYEAYADNNQPPSKQ